MQPHFLRIGSVYVYTYGVLLVVAFAVAMWLAARAAREWPASAGVLTPSQVGEWGSVAMLGGLIGGRAWYVLQYWDVFKHQPLEILAIWHGGLVWYGGFLGGVVATWGFVRGKRLTLRRVLDQVIPFVALSHAIGRVGCFLNGCCYGKPTIPGFGVVFPQHPDELRIPTQLLEAAALVGLYVMLRMRQRPQMLTRPGRLFGIYLVGYAAVRFVLEFFRGDQTASWGPLTIPQVVSVVVAVVAGFLLMVQWGRHDQSASFKRGPA